MQCRHAKNGELKVIDLIRSTRGNHGAFVDVGANKGEWSEAVQKYGGGRLVLTDPLKRNLDVERNKLISRGLTITSYAKMRCPITRRK